MKKRKKKCKGRTACPQCKKGKFEPTPDGTALRRPDAFDPSAS
jgi:hypothetical protein